MAFEFAGLTTGRPVGASPALSLSPDLKLVSLSECHGPPCSQPAALPHGCSCRSGRNLPLRQQEKLSAVQDRDLNTIQAHSCSLHPASPTQSWQELSLSEPQLTGSVETGNTVRCMGSKARGKAVSSGPLGQCRELR